MFGRPVGQTQKAGFGRFPQQHESVLVFQFYSYVLEKDTSDFPEAYSSAIAVRSRFRTS